MLGGPRPACCHAVELARRTRPPRPFRRRVAALHRRFTELKAATEEHSRLLNTSLEDKAASLQLVQAQLASLLVGAADG